MRLSAKIPAAKHYPLSVYRSAYDAPHSVDGMIDLFKLRKFFKTAGLPVMIGLFDDTKSRGTLRFAAFIFVCCWVKLTKNARLVQ